MKIIISEDKVNILIKKLLNQIYPRFNKEDTGISRYKNNFKYYDKENYEVYAIYWGIEKELQLETKLYDILKNYIGDNLIKFVIDWFNKEFSQDAEFIAEY